MYISYAIGLAHSYFLISFSGLILIEKLSITQRKQNYFTEHGKRGMPTGSFYQLKNDRAKMKRLVGGTRGVKDSLFQELATPTYVCSQERFQRKRRKEDEE